MREPELFLESWWIFRQPDCTFPSALSEGHLLSEGDFLTFGFLHTEQF